VARPRRGMGRGLEAILSVSDGAGVRAQDELREVPLELIAPSSNQPRRRFDARALEALAGSLGERGVLQPVLVRPKPDGGYELVAGERRWRAAKIAGLRAIPALVRERGDAEALELALIENMAREDLNPVEEARACDALVEELGLTREEVGRRVGRSRVAVSNLMRLLDLPDETLALLEEGLLSEGHGRALLLAEDHDVRRRLGRSAVEHGWSVRTLEERARGSNERDRPGARSRRGPKRRITPHPDQLEAAQKIASALERALGLEVRVSAAREGGYRAELSLASVQEATALAARVGATKSAPG
jgi:ParB family transcriptional regulator, chromosome partitioning protein